MSLFKLLHSQSHHQISLKIKSFSPSLSHFSRTLCSSTPPSQDSEQTNQSEHSEKSQETEKSEKTPHFENAQQGIQPVSYAVKPKEPSVDTSHQESENYSPNGGRQGEGMYEGRGWTREDVRYVKDMPGISPVAYASRVAPLPGDRVAGELERMRIEYQDKMPQHMRRVVRWGRAEEDKAPFPTLIKVDKGSNKKKVVYDLKDAINHVKASAKGKFVETLEAHVKLTPEMRRTDLKVSGSVMLPHGTTKNVKVAVFAEGAAADDARDAGADIVGGRELIEGIKNGTVKIDFDICYATVDIMRHVKQLGRQLTRLMPKKEHGTITEDVGRSVREIKGSGVLFRKDKTAIVHVGLGKVDLEEDALRENVSAFANALLLAKPAGLKKSSKYAGYVETFHLCSTMGPSFPVSMQSITTAVDRYSRLQKV